MHILRSGHKSLMSVVEVSNFITLLEFRSYICILFFFNLSGALTCGIRLERCNNRVDNGGTNKKSKMYEDCSRGTR